MDLQNYIDKHKQSIVSLYEIPDSKNMVIVFIGEALGIDHLIYNKDDKSIRVATNKDRKSYKLSSLKNWTDFAGFDKLLNQIGYNYCVPQQA